MKTVFKSDITDALKRAGLQRGDAVMVHTLPGKIGYVCGNVPIMARGGQERSSGQICCGLGQGLEKDADQAAAPAPCSRKGMCETGSLKLKGIPDIIKPKGINRMNDPLERMKKRRIKGV